MPLVSQQYPRFLSPKDQKSAGPSLGSYLCLYTQLCKLQDHGFLPSVFGAYRLSRGLYRLPGGRGWCLPMGGWSWVLALLGESPCQGACLEIAVGSGNFSPPICWQMELGSHLLFDLRCPSSETYRLLGGVRSLHQGCKMSASSCRSCKSPYVCHLLLCPQRESQSPPALQETFLRPIGRSSGPGVCRVTALALGTTLCVPP